MVVGAKYEKINLLPITSYFKAQLDFLVKMSSKEFFKC